MTTLLLIRHGENDLVGRKLAGRMPGVHINENGRKQAEGVAQVLGKAPIKAIYSSPMERAYETAQPLATALGLEVQIRPGLIETDFGRFQGRTFKQLQRAKLWKEALSHPAEGRFPDGESFTETQTRVVNDLEAIAALHGEQDIVACFTHADVVRLATAYYLQMPISVFQRLSINTTSVTVIVRVKDEVFVPHVNQVAGFEIKMPEKKEEKGKPPEEKEQPAQAKGGK